MTMLVAVSFEFPLTEICFIVLYTTSVVIYIKCDFFGEKVSMAIHDGAPQSFVQNFKYFFHMIYLNKCLKILLFYYLLEKQTIKGAWCLLCARILEYL